MAQVLVPLLTFIGAAGVLTITPGVDTAMVLRTSSAAGLRGGVSASIGIWLGLLAWGAGAAFGLTALLATLPLAFDLVRWAGAIYLLYLGVRLILKPRSVLTPDRNGPSEATGEGRNAFRRGFLSNILNPKVGVFYVTFLPQFIPQGVNLAAFSLLLALAHVLLTAVWFSMLIALTVRLGRLLSSPCVVLSLDRLTGCVFVGFGFKLTLSEHR